MKKVILTTALVLGLSTSASAGIMYNDNFLGGQGDGVYQNIDMWGFLGPKSVTFNFDITDDGYNSATQSIVAAGLSFDLWSEDWADETVTITSGILDGDQLIAEQWYKLGGETYTYTTKKWDRSEKVWVTKTHTGTRNSADTDTLNIDLDLSGLLDYTQDGMFSATVAAYYEGDCDPDNDFRIEGANFNAEAAPVPEPGTMLLMGIGLAGLVGYNRKRKK
jgi:hypothetical protein